MEKSEHVKGTSPETDVVKWTFKDGTILDVKLEEHSVRNLCLSDWLIGFVCMTGGREGVARGFSPTVFLINI